MEYEFQRGQYLISTDRGRIDLQTVHTLLTKTYWAEGMNFETLRKATIHSLCYGIYAGEEQVGFARVVTDYSTFAYLTDVVIDERHRGHGLSKWLVECILSHPDLLNLRRFALLTHDAQDLYQRFGFSPLEHPERYMEIYNPHVYKTGQAETRFEPS